MFFFRVATIGFEIDEISVFSNPPGYSNWIPIVHQIFCIWTYALNKFSWLDRLAINHVVRAHKPIQGS